MKKICTWIVCLLATMTTMTFSSCTVDEDTHEAMMLSGQWTGDFGMFYEIQDRWGNWHRFDSYDTDLVFYPDYDYATHGTGKQVDYYREGPYAYQYYYFDWSVRNGVVYLTYPYDPELNTAIYNYSMNHDYFSGRFDGSSSTFRLRKLVDYYNWDYYHGNYMYAPCYDYYYDYYDFYAKQRDGGNTENAPAPEIRRGNRFSNK